MPKDHSPTSCLVNKIRPAKKQEIIAHVKRSKQITDAGRTHPSILEVLPHLCPMTQISSEEKTCRSGVDSRVQADWLTPRNETTRKDDRPIHALPHNSRGQIALPVHLATRGSRKKYSFSLLVYICRYFAAVRFRGLDSRQGPLSKQPGRTTKLGPKKFLIFLIQIFPYF